MEEPTRVVQDRSFAGVAVIDELEAEGAYRFVRCSFAGADVEDTDLSGSVFEACQLDDTRFVDAILSGARFIGCRGERVRLARADLTDTVWTGCDLIGAGLRGAQIGGARIRDSRLIACELRDLHGIGWTIAATSLHSSDLKGMVWKSARLRDVDFSESDLRDADFTDAVFETGCRLAHANWLGAKFENCDLRGADLGPLDSGQALNALRGAWMSPRQAVAVVRALGIQVAEPGA